MRRVMYLYLPDWPIDRLRRLKQGRNQSVPGRSAAPADEPPFATVVSNAGRRLLAAVNPAASAAGLAPGMPLADALSFLPVLATAEAEPQAAAAALVRLAEWCQRYSPWTAPDFSPGVESDGVKIEITGCAHLWGGEAELAADLARRLSRPLGSDKGIAHRLAVAGTLGAAWALARFAAESGRPFMPVDEKAALAPLPVAALRLDPLTAAGLRRVGLRHVGNLYQMPRDALARRFGEGVVRRLDQALGQEPEPLTPLGEAPVRRVRLSFAEPIADPADFARAIERLVADLSARLEREGAGARRLGLGFHRVDGCVEHIRIGTARPTRDPRHLAALFIARLDTIDPGLGVEDMILVLYAADSLPPEQAKYIGGGDGSPASVAQLLDRLGARLGRDALSRIAPHASHIPERAAPYVSVGNRPHPDPPPLAGEGASRSTDAINPLPRKRGRVGVGASAKPPRPIRLFAPPEPIEAAIWVLPDDPPLRFTWRRRLYRVSRADGPERIAAEWWTEEGSAAVDALRDYYRVEDEEGRRFWLFRAGLPEKSPQRWYVHGSFS